ncbi:unnamed protein product [Arabidopsis thaliana]|uniref:Uncharacterized protein n=3 Tax=Arabidopsis TaxID=3701 RepID=A0A178V5W1_ARATH|nr:Low-molecular-weight cysteine-rich family [Arabidopsis thaliana x Arabidopsis arenosa]KAG7621381.1 Low-molecular-weight cysteine-rich family [Arabidopsis suecica]OAP01171.1 hypothetical protein AXX17_AT4G25830 [Arabidopsis thaliana]CAA0396108.1 unnamed protein product [Arabidopsis thaliana]VYS63529.1 unnamed protein product [Arabidopsis thaliana]
MGSLRLSTVAIAVVVCLSILLISPTEVDGRQVCDYDKGECNSYEKSSTCIEPCKQLDSKFIGGRCIPVGGITGMGLCVCCRDVQSGAEKESM